MAGSRVSYRQTRKFKTSVEAITAWVRATEVAASSLEVAPFDERRLRASIEQLRGFTRMRAENIMEPVQTLCSSAGVAVVWVPELPHTAISGCARWLSNNKAIIGLTIRYKTDDQMWFTFFHELGHILLHRKTHVFVLDNAVDTLSDNVVDPEMQKQEEEANCFARDAIIPPQALARFIRADDCNEALKRFAEETGIGPGLVVGRLQHDGLLKPHEGNAFKQRIALGVDEDA